MSTLAETNDVQERRFTCFGEMPPEIRLMIWDLFLDSIDKVVVLERSASRWKVFRSLPLVNKECWEEFTRGSRQRYPHRMDVICPEACREWKCDRPFKAVDFQNQVFYMATLPETANPDWIACSCFLKENPISRILIDVANWTDGTVRELKESLYCNEVLVAVGKAFYLRPGDKGYRAASLRDWTHHGATRPAPEKRLGIPIPDTTEFIDCAQIKDEDEDDDYELEAVPGMKNKNPQPEEDKLNKKGETQLACSIAHHFKHTSYLWEEKVWQAKIDPSIIGMPIDEVFAKGPRVILTLTRITPKALPQTGLHDPCNPFTKECKEEKKQD
jgi:hypothetical protein